LASLNSHTENITKQLLIVNTLFAQKIPQPKLEAFLDSFSEP